MDDAFREAIAAHRPALLRHCYRMLGSFAEAEDQVQDAALQAWRARKSFAGKAPLAHWLHRIATNGCLTALARNKRLVLPQLERAPGKLSDPLDTREAAWWLTPAPDAQLFSTPAEAAEGREQIALAFVALLQRLPPRQRAVLLLKDVVGWPAEEIAQALELSLPSVNSALHRARQTMAKAREPSGTAQDRHDEPAAEALREYIRSWEQHDLPALVALLRRDMVLSMPPHSIWFRGARLVERFFQTPRFAAFWAAGLWLEPTRANGLPAVAFFLRDAAGAYRPHSLQTLRFTRGKLAEATTFIGAHYLRGFALPVELHRTVSRRSNVLG